MRITKRTYEIQIEQEWSMQREDDKYMQRCGVVHIAVREDGVNVTATGTLPPEGIQALKDALAVAEVFCRNGLDD